MNNYSYGFSDFSSSTSFYQYNFPCPFNAKLDVNGNCVCEDNFIGNPPNECILPLHEYLFYGPANANYVNDTADVSLYNGALKHGTVVGNVALVNDRAEFSSSGFIKLDDDIFESSPAITLEIWLTTYNDNSLWERLFHFSQDDETNCNSILFNRVESDFTFESSNFYSGNMMFEFIDCRSGWTAHKFPINYLFNGQSQVHYVVTIDPFVTKKFSVYRHGSNVYTGDFAAELDYSLPWINMCLGGNDIAADNLEDLSGIIHEFRVWRGVMDSNTVYSRYASGFVTTQFPTPEPTSPSPQPTPSPSPQPTVMSVIVTNEFGDQFQCPSPPKPGVIGFQRCIPL